MLGLLGSHLRAAAVAKRLGPREITKWRWRWRCRTSITCSLSAVRLASSSSAIPKLDLLALDKKWQEKWRGDEHRQAAEQTPRPCAQPKPKFYVLSMFPYPSGTLHMGHLRVYTISDVLARFYRMRGHDVLHPMGWDAFGLPAENAAIERGIDPAEWTRSNISKMKEQLRSISTRFDWDRELATCDPEFYEHTQRIFLMLYEKGLAYQAEAMVNYDPVDKTVLANEQVDANGFSWRSGAKVEQLKLKQWFFRITEFKESLLKDLDSLAGGWPEHVLSMQRNWLGRSEGAKIRFPVLRSGQPETEETIGVFTTRPDTLYGVEYLALSLDHPIVVEAAERDENLQKFLDTASSLPPDSKVGYRLQGLSVTHPMRVIDKESESVARELPIFAAPYVLSTYGEGAVMGVPGHDSRDLLFFKENISPGPVPVVVQPESTAEPLNDMNTTGQTQAFTGEGILTSECWKYQGLHSREVARVMVDDLKRIGLGEPAEKWKLRDWLISRQRYWGAPIPIVHCSDCGPVPVPTEELPVKLPKIDDHWLKGKTGNPLESAEEWLQTKCPSCGSPARRDTDTMDTFVDSSWYFLRYLDPKNQDLPFSPAVARPVDVYIGGVEHAILHLLYARFIYKFLAQSGLFPEMIRMGEVSGPFEPFKTLLSQGMVHGKTYSEPSTGRFLLPSEIDLTNPDKPLIKGTQIAPHVSYEKMSKSKHNGVDPTACVSKYGADATRAHVLFAAPVSEVVEWDEAKIVGIERWFSRLWKTVHEARDKLMESSFTLPSTEFQTQSGRVAFNDDDDEHGIMQSLSDADANALLATHNTISSVTSCIENNPYGLNTVISDLIKLTNLLATSLPTSSPHVLYLSLSSLLRLLAPVAPALTSECWQLLHEAIIIHDRGVESHTTDSSPPVPVPVPPVSVSVFESSWPAPLLTPEQVNMLSIRGGQTVAVQINGKLRFSVTIPHMQSPSTIAQLSSTADGINKSLEESSSSSLSAPSEQDWILDRILETEQGRVWLRERNDWERRKRVVVVERGGKGKGKGKLVNVVF